MTKGPLGPDRSRCGQPVEWQDMMPPPEEFVDAVARAINTPGIDIELQRWPIGDSLSEQYGEYWAKEARALRRAILSMNTHGLQVTVARRQDKGDGFYKCYVRANRKRMKAVA